MSSDTALLVAHISKCYKIYDHPRDRLLQVLGGKRKRLFRPFWAVKDVSFELKKGRTIGIWVVMDLVKIHYYN